MGIGWIFFGFDRNRPRDSPRSPGLAARALQRIQMCGGSSEDRGDSRGSASTKFRENPAGLRISIVNMAGIFPGCGRNRPRDSLISAGLAPHIVARKINASVRGEPRGSKGFPGVGFDRIQGKPSRSAGVKYVGIGWIFLDLVETARGIPQDPPGSPRTLLHEKAMQTRGASPVDQRDSRGSASTKSKENPAG